MLIAARVQMTSRLKGAGKEEGIEVQATGKADDIQATTVW